MIDKKKQFLHTAEMAEHAEGFAQYLEALVAGKTRDIADYLFPGKKRNIESCPFASNEQKDTEIHRREMSLNVLKSFMGV